LMFGREARLPIDVIRSSNSTLALDEYSYQIEHTQMLKDAYDIVRTNLLSNAVSRQENWKENLRFHHTFAVGDKVSIYKPKLASDSNEPSRSHVWKASWLGPFTVTAKPFPNTDVYALKDETSGRQFTMNSHKIRPFNSRDYLNSSSIDVAQTVTQQSRRLDADVPSSPIVDAQLDRLDEVIPTLGSDDDNSGQRQLETPSSTPSSSSSRLRSRPKRKSRSKPSRHQHLIQPGQDEPDLTRHDVKQIKSHKKKGNLISYLVEWADPRLSDTWQTKADFGPRSSNWDCLLYYWHTQEPEDRPRWYYTEVKKQPRS